MVFEIKKFKLDLAGREEPLTLSLDFNAISKLAKYYENAYVVIGKFIAGDMDVVPALIRCCADVELSEEEIKSNLPFNYKTMHAISEMFNDLIGSEIIGEIEEVTEKN